MILIYPIVCLLFPVLLPIHGGIWMLGNS